MLLRLYYDVYHRADQLCHPLTYQFFWLALMSWWYFKFLIIVEIDQT